MRAAGKRFTPLSNEDGARLQVLTDAFAVGAGYVELRERSGRLRAVATNRLLDIDSAAIAPMACAPSHFSRLHPRGQCPMCKGLRGIEVAADTLIIANKSIPPVSEHFLTSQANMVMKGVRHNELSPFLRRLEKEGLWDQSIPFARLEQSKRELLLFGFWARPGAGSFLKSPKADPSEVDSWLRWDGLYRHVLKQASKSPDEEWVRCLREATRVQPCVLCGGTGLHRFAGLLRVGDMAFNDWVRERDYRQIFDQLGRVEPRTARQHRTRDRILHCLNPIARQSPSVARVIERSVAAFTTMKSAEAGSFEET